MASASTTIPVMASISMFERPGGSGGHDGYDRIVWAVSLDGFISSHFAQMRRENLQFFAILGDGPAGDGNAFLFETIHHGLIG